MKATIVKIEMGDGTWTIVDNAGAFNDVVVSGIGIDDEIEGRSHWYTANGRTVEVVTIGLDF